MNFIFTLEEVGLRDAPLVGEEAAKLGELLRIGARVPAAFVVPTSSYAEYLNYPAVKDALKDCGSSDLEELKARLLGVSLPPVPERSLRSSYRALSGPRDTFVSLKAGIIEQRAIGEEELIYGIKKLWAEHLARQRSLKEGLPLNPLPILVQQIEERDVEGRLFTSDPYSADLEVVVVEVDHRDGKEKFFLEKRSNAKSASGGGTDQLKKRLVTGVVENGASLELFSTLSSWATKIEKILNGPQELRWGARRETPTFLSINPLYLRKRIPMPAKLWILVVDSKDVVPDEVEGVITTNADGAVKSAKEFPTKPVLLALKTVEREELAIIRRARHKDRRRNLHLVLPPVRTADGLREIKKEIAGEGLPRGPNLKFYFRAAFPANVVLLDRFLELGMDGVVFDAENLTRGFLGVRESVKPDDSLLWALDNVQQKCRGAGLELLYLGNNFDKELLVNLLEKGVTQIVANVADKETLLSTLAVAGEKMLATRSLPYRGQEESSNA